MIKNQKVITIEKKSIMNIIIVILIIVIIGKMILILTIKIIIPLLNIT